MCRRAGRHRYNPFPDVALPIFPFCSCFYFSYRWPDMCSFYLKPDPLLRINITILEFNTPAFKFYLYIKEYTIKPSNPYYYNYYDTYNYNYTGQFSMIYLYPRFKKLAATIYSQSCAEDGLLCTFKINSTVMDRDLILSLPSDNYGRTNIQVINIMSY